MAGSVTVKWALRFRKHPCADEIVDAASLISECIYGRVAGTAQQVISQIHYRGRTDAGHHYIEGAALTE